MAVNIEVIDESVKVSSQDEQVAIETDGAIEVTTLNVIQETPLFANSIEECTDTSKVYVLPDGYIYAYMSSARDAYINQIPISTDADGNIYNGKGYKNGYRFNSSNAETTNTGTFITGFIPIKPRDTVYLNGNYIDASHSLAGSLRHMLYKSDKTTMLTTFPMGSSEQTGQHISTFEVNDDGYVTSFTLSETWSYVSGWEELAYIRLNLLGSGEGCIVTVNEEIVDAGSSVSYAWKNTGHAFVPADYEDRIIELKNKSEAHELLLYDFENRLTEIEDDKETENDTDIPSYWQTAINSAKTKITNIQADCGVNGVSFVWTTDIHASTGLNEKGKRLGLVAKAIMDEADIPLFVSTGDIASQSSHSNSDNNIAEIELAKTWFKPIPYYQQALIMGNHDGAWGDTTSGYYYKQLPLDIMYNLIYRKQAMDFRRVSGDNGTYYYLDNESHKMRFIFLNSNNTPDYEENADGTAKYDRFHAPCYCQTQLDWLSNIALDMPEGFTACIFSHEPYAGDWSLLVGIVDAYNNKGTYKNTFADSANTWRNSSVDVNFADAKGEIAGVFAGHTHKSEMRYTGNNPMYSTCPLIILANSLGGEVRDGTTRTDGTATEFAMDIVTVNTRNKTIHMTRLGAGSDRSVSY